MLLRRFMSASVMPLKRQATVAKQLEELYHLSKTVNAVSSTLEKKRLIAASAPECHTIMKRIYDPHFRLHVTSKNVLKYLDKHDSDHSFGEPLATLEDLLDALSARRITGHAALDATASFYQAFCRSEETQQIFWRILDRNLKMGVSTQTVRQVLVPTDQVDENTDTDSSQLQGASDNHKSTRCPFTSVALAFTHKKEKDIWTTLSNDKWFASRKLDGVRCLAVVNGKYDIQFYSRTGRPFSSLQKVEAAIRARIQPDHTPFVLDGEICVFKETDDGNKLEDFLETIRQIRTKQKPMTNPMYEVFDLISAEGVRDGFDPTPFIERQHKLGAFLGASQPHICRVHQRLVDRSETLQYLQDLAVKRGWEGLILRRNGPYHGKRSRDLVKLKEWDDAEYVVKDIEIGWMRMSDTGKNERVMTSVVIEHKGNRVSVGSGFTLDQRRRYGNAPAGIVGNQITVRYFAESLGDSGVVSLRFPTVKAVYEGNRDV
ncbi:hypothetical protein BCR43DRAFT_483696 [Syncephalastrum racemosum]|uniref:ATP-dependent DNA ligase family profile domain-containing protein n=1 Tax=Syncephalastrum racemosum TaxID=13706 RepID=A0A1X2HVP4_SYNRA|nr:hypothetical protein BCR43DRAFT_483696 [Syncephalastrum racemosum]